MMDEKLLEALRKEFGDNVHVHDANSASIGLQVCFPDGDGLGVELIRRGCLHGDPLGPWLVQWTDTVWADVFENFDDVAADVNRSYSHEIAIDGGTFSMRCVEKDIVAMVARVGSFALEVVHSCSALRRASVRVCHVSPEPQNGGIAR